MKEDVLEQIVDDYLQWRGYFTIHNVRFRPSSDHPDYRPRVDSVRSDVDSSASTRTGGGTIASGSFLVNHGSRVSVLIAYLLSSKAVPGSRSARDGRARELWTPKWAEAFVAEIERRTDTRRFTYFLAVTRVSGDVSVWENVPTIRANLGGNPFKFLTLETVWSEILKEITTTPASSEIGRLAQLLKVAKLTTARPDDVAD